MVHCYCGKNQAYDACCGVYIDQGQKALSPEVLMRSRYSAYVQAKVDYIEATMCGPAAQYFEPLQARQWAESCHWLRLEVLKARYDRQDSNRAMVEFKAYYRQQDIEYGLHEKSIFIRKHSRWFYYDVE